LNRKRNIEDVVARWIKKQFCGDIKEIIRKKQERRFIL